VSNKRTEPGRLDLLQGTLDMLILKALAWEARHGYAIARWIQEMTDDALSVEEGSLYPALHRLVGRRWVRAEWGRSENTRRAKYYVITARGRKQLEAETLKWEQFTKAIARVLAAQPV
jgi:PadR family transcriptional regulator PadR